jgi:hypothetical protein
MARWLRYQLGLKKRSVRHVPLAGASDARRTGRTGDDPSGVFKTAIDRNNTQAPPEMGIISTLSCLYLRMVNPATPDPCIQPIRLGLAAAREEWPVITQGADTEGDAPCAAFCSAPMRVLCRAAMRSRARTCALAFFIVSPEAAKPSK